MNWDISIGRCKEMIGRGLQELGMRFARRQWVLDGETMEYTGRLQSRYGMLKHRVQWGNDAARLKPLPISLRERRSS